MRPALHDKIDRYDINITNFVGERAPLPHLVQNCDVSRSPDLIGLYFAAHLCNVIFMNILYY